MLRLQAPELMAVIRVQLLRQPLNNQELEAALEMAASGINGLAEKIEVVAENMLAQAAKEIAESAKHSTDSPDDGSNSGQ